MKAVATVLASVLLAAAAGTLYARNESAARELCAKSEDAARCEQRVEWIAALRRVEDGRLRAAREACKDQAGPQRRACLRAHLPRVAPPLAPRG